MVVKHCCYGLCTSDNRYPNKLPSGTCFLPFAKPGTIKDNMTEWEKRQHYSVTEDRHSHQIIDRFMKIRLLRYGQYFTEMTGKSGIR